MLSDLETRVILDLINIDDVDGLTAYLFQVEGPLTRDESLLFARACLAPGNMKLATFELLCDPVYQMLGHFQSMFEEVCLMNDYFAIEAFCEHVGIKYFDFDVLDEAGDALMNACTTLIVWLINNNCLNTLDFFFVDAHITDASIDDMMNFELVSDVQGVARTVPGDFPFPLTEGLVRLVARHGVGMHIAWIKEYVRLNRMDYFQMALDELPNRDIMIEDIQTALAFAHSIGDDRPANYLIEKFRTHAYDAEKLSTIAAYLLYVHDFDDARVHMIELALNEAVIVYLSDDELVRAGNPALDRIETRDEIARRVWVRQGMVWSQDVNRFLPSYTRAKILEFVMAMKLAYPGVGTNVWRNNIRQIVQADTFDKYTPPAL